MHEGVKMQRSLGRLLTEEKQMLSVVQLHEHAKQNHALLIVAFRQASLKARIELV